MASLRAASTSGLACAQRSAPRALAPLRAPRRLNVKAQAQQESRDVPAEAIKGVITASTLGSLLASAPSAQAATEIMQLAASDNRYGQRSQPSSIEGTEL